VLDDRQAETGAAGRAVACRIDPVEALEDVMEGLLRDACAVVGDLEHHAVPIATSSEAHGTAGWRVLQGVVDEIAQHLPHVVGVDVDAFVENPGPDARLMRHQSLRAQIPELLTLEDTMRPYRELLSWQQTKAGIHSVLRGDEMCRKEAEEESFQQDGKIIYHRREAELSRGDYDLASACEYTRKEYRRLFQDYVRLSPMRVKAWQAFTEICRTEEIEVIAFITPWRKETLASVESTGLFEARHTDVTSLVQETLPTFGRLADFTEIESFNGDPELFVDGVHPLEPNTRRMIDALFSNQQLLVSQAPHAL